MAVDYRKEIWDLSKRIREDIYAIVLLNDSHINIPFYQSIYPEPPTRLINIRFRNAVAGAVPANGLCLTFLLRASLDIPVAS